MDILLVDDDPATCGTFAIGLKDAAHDVRAALTGAEAIALARSKSFHLALIDLKLPDMSGLNVLREFRNSQPTAAAVLITGYASVATAVEAMRLGATDYLEKPIDLDTLIGLIDKTIERPRAVTVANSAGDPSEASDLPKHRRWAELMVSGLTTSGELNTLDDWSQAAHVSRSTVENRCRAVRISAKASIDLLRVLRAVADAGRFHCTPDLVIDADPRTVRRLIDTSRIALRSGDGDLEQCLDRQQFVTYAPAVAALKRALRGSRTLSPHPVPSREHPLV